MLELAYFFLVFLPMGFAVGYIFGGRKLEGRIVMWSMRRELKRDAPPDEEDYF